MATSGLTATNKPALSRPVKSKTGNLQFLALMGSSIAELSPFLKSNRLDQKTTGSSIPDPGNLLPIGKCPMVDSGFPMGGRINLHFHPISTHSSL